MIVIVGESGVFAVVLGLWTWRSGEKGRRVCFAFSGRQAIKFYDVLYVHQKTCTNSTTDIANQKP